MDLKEINDLIDKLIEKGVNEFELEREGFRIRIRRDNPVLVADNPAVTPSAAAVAEHPAAPNTIENSAAAAIEEPVKPVPPGGDTLHLISSPMVGTFYRAPSPGAKPYVEIGDRVKKGQVCCIVEAMKLMNEILIDANGVIKEIHVENAQPVEYGEPLFTIEKTR